MSANGSRSRLMRSHLEAAVWCAIRHAVETRPDPPWRFVIGLAEPDGQLLLKVDLSFSGTNQIHAAPADHPDGVTLSDLGIEHLHMPPLLALRGERDLVAARLVFGERLVAAYDLTHRRLVIDERSLARSMFSGRAARRAALAFEVVGLQP